MKIRPLLLLASLAWLTAGCSPAPATDLSDPVGSAATPATTPTVPTPTAASTATSEPTAEPTATPAPISFAQPDFVFQGADPSVPTLPREPSASFNNLYINPGGVLFHDGQFHMFFNSFTKWPGLVEIGYAVSPDGYAWQLAQSQPVITSAQIPFGENASDVSSVVVLDDGTWVMYFHTVRDGRIGLATAEDPTGPWTPTADPVLIGGPEGAWDEDGVYWPNVVKTESGFYMYYTGESFSDKAIGLAQSADGVNWAKYDDPATTAAEYAESDPVFVSEAGWESKRVSRPRVQFTPDGWVMIYAGAAIDKRGLAISTDGIHWDSYPANPILTPDDFPIPGRKTWDTALLYHDGAYFYYMEIGNLSGTDLYLAVHSGLLAGDDP